MSGGPPPRHRGPGIDPYRVLGVLIVSLGAAAVWLLIATLLWWLFA